MPSPKGAVPWQLRQAKRPAPGKSTRPILEQLPAISVNDLQVPQDYKTYSLRNITLWLPQLAGAILSFNQVEFHHPSLHRRGEPLIQTFKLKQIKTGFGTRHAFICTCGRPVIKLYYVRRLACRRCSKARYATQILGPRSRPILQASRIQSFLDNKPRLLRRTRDRLQKRLGEKLMMAQTRLGTRATGLWEGW